MESGLGTCIFSRNTVFLLQGVQGPDLGKCSHRKGLGTQRKNRIRHQETIGPPVQVPLGGRGEAMGEQMKKPLEESGQDHFMGEGDI